MSGTLAVLPEDAARPAWSRLSQRWSPRHLHEQFILCRDAARVPDSWTTTTLGGWHLGHHATLPVSALTGANGTTIGFLLGYAVTAGGSRLEASPVAANGTETPTEFERWLFTLGGRFAAVIITEKWSRVYLDPCGSLGVVFSPLLEIVAATPTLIPRTRDTDELADLVAATGGPTQDWMCPVGITTRRNIFRLLPNHYLDLKTWQATRHWPSATLSDQGETSSHLDEIAHVTERMVAGFAARQDVLLALTAGRDSRMLLAAAKKWASRIILYTAAFEYPDKVSWQDLLISGRIGERFGIRVQHLPFRAPAEHDLEEWLYRTAGQVGEVRGWRGMTTLLQLPPNLPNFISPIPELIRGLYWRFIDPARHPIELGPLLQICKAGDSPACRTALTKWLDELPSRDPVLTLDLFYVEQRLGCWAGVYTYGLGHDGRYAIFPFCHRRIITAMMSLPAEPRFGDSLQRDFVQRYWPELMDYPFNRVSGLDRARLHLHLAPSYALKTAQMAGRVIANPGRVVKVIKKHVKKRLSNDGPSWS
jgi:hypothetical protein